MTSSIDSAQPATRGSFGINRFSAMAVPMTFYFVAPLESVLLSSWDRE